MHTTTIPQVPQAMRDATAARFGNRRRTFVPLEGGGWIVEVDYGDCGGVRCLYVGERGGSFTFHDAVEVAA